MTKKKSRHFGIYFVQKKLHSFWFFISQDKKLPFRKCIFASNVNKLKSKKHSSRNSHQMIALEVGRGLVNPEVNKSEQVSIDGHQMLTPLDGEGSLSSEFPYPGDRARRWVCPCPVRFHVKGNGHMGFPPPPPGWTEYLIDGRTRMKTLPAISLAGGKYVIQ